MTLGDSAAALCIAVFSVRGIGGRRGGHDPGGLDFRQALSTYFSFREQMKPFPID